MSLSIGLIKADIKTARNNISPFVNFSNDELMNIKNRSDE